MKKLVLVAIFTLGVAFAKDDMITVQLSKIMDNKTTQEILGDSVEFSFGKGGAGNIVGREFYTHKKTKNSKKTNKKFKESISGKEYAFDKYDRVCGWALLSALKEARKTALNAGASKVVNIVSYYKQQREFDSKDSFECAIGSMMIGVAIKYDIAK